MPLKNFLNLILPNEGVKCWVEIARDKSVTQGFTATIGELADKLQEIDSRGSDAYYACASYLSPRSRRAGNAFGTKAFWLDIDISTPEKEKDYAAFEDALQACDEFCARLSLPVPGIVRSGYGIHAYWPLDRELHREEWLHIAQRLKLLTVAYGFHVDPSRTADIASILRPPGTKNYKIPEQPREVAVDDWDLFEPIDTTGFIECVLQAALAVPVGRPATGGGAGEAASSPTNNTLLAGITVSKAFDHTKGVAAGSRGSTQLKYAGQMVAKGLPVEEVLAKCMEWNQLCTPPQEEKEVRRIVASAFTMHASKHPAPLPPQEAPALPALPLGYRWGNGGQLLVKQVDKDDQGKETESWRIVSQLPVYLEAWMNEEGHKIKNSYLFSHYHPKKGWQQFIMGAKEFNGSDWYGSWVENGGSIVDGSDKFFKTYVRRAENMLRLPGKELVRYTQFGWKDEDQAFLVGENLCHADGKVEKAFGTDKLTPLMKTMQPARNGSLADWTTAANKLGTPGMEAHLFMVMASLAAPLMKFCVDEGNGGSILSIISEESGYGKTPMATAAASVWGELGSIVVTGNFTENRRIEELVRHCHLPQIQEEAAYSDPAVAALGIEKFTSGTDRGRLNQAGSATGIPERYQTIMLSLSNKSLYELVKMVNVPMSRRIFEIEIERPASDDLANLGGIAREMMRNCGYAGLAFARIIVAPEIRKYIIENLSGSNIGQVGRVQLKYRELLHSQPEHRFIIWLISAVEVASRIATHYGLLNFDVERLMRWISTRGQDRIDGPNHEDASGKLNNFMSEHVAECLTVAGPYNAKNGPLLPIKLPTRKLSMRLEMRNERLYISTIALQKWCTKNNVSFISLGKKLLENAVLLERGKKITLGAGTEIASGRELCWEIDMGHPQIKGDLRIELREESKEKIVNL